MAKQRGGKSGKSSEEAAAARIERRLQKLDDEIADSESADEPAEGAVSVAEFRPDPAQATEPEPEPPKDFWTIMAALDDLHLTWRSLEDELSDYAAIQAAIRENPDDPGIAPEIINDFIIRAVRAMTKEIELFRNAERGGASAVGSAEGKAAVMAMKRARLKGLRPNLEKIIFKTIRESAAA